MAVNALLAIENDDAPKMDPSFRALLVANKMPTKLIDLMERENILSPEDLPRYCGSTEGILKLVLNMCDETRNQRKYMPFLVKMFEEAQASNKESAERKAKGTEDEEIERPLPEHDKPLGR